MPLKPGSDRATISQNIREMMASGHKMKQAVAAAMSEARKSKGKGKASGHMPMHGKMHGKGK